MTASIMHRAQHAQRTAIAAQQVATDNRNRQLIQNELTPVTVATIGQMIKRRLTVRQYGAYLVAIRRSN